MLKNRAFIIFIILLGLLIGARVYMWTKGTLPGPVPTPTFTTSDPLEISEEYRRVGNLEKSESYARMAFEKAMTPDRKAYILFSLGETLKLKGDYKRAGEVLLEGITAGEKFLGRDHPAVATAYYTLGQVEQAILDYEKAELYYRHALEIREKKYGRAPETAMIAGDLATIYRETGKYKEAEKEYLKAINILKENSVRYHSELSAQYNHLSELYCQMGLYDRAINQCKKALEIDRLFNDDHGLGIVRDLNDIAQYHLASGKTSQAGPFLAEAREWLGRMPEDIRNTSDYSLFSFETHLFSFYMAMANKNPSTAIEELEKVKYWLSLRNTMIKGDIEDNSVMFGMTLSALEELGAEIKEKGGPSEKFEHYHKIMGESIQKGDFKTASNAMEKILDLSSPLFKGKK
ncbi:MAG: tetratricopeptide repeat protein [Candidatus Eremiobacteraeota bacterium]|nr:tetratricopeptide repeat protein [Candidatus Eremiobacteraeota bacterium]